MNPSNWNCLLVKFLTPEAEANVQLVMCVACLFQEVIVFADEKQKGLKVFCQLCEQVYRDPYITSCGVSVGGGEGGII